MDLHQQGLELLQSEGFGKTSSTLISNSDFELFGLRQVETVLCVGHHQHLTDSHPIFVVGDVDGTIRSTASLSQNHELSLLTSTSPLALKGAMKCDDLITLMFAIASPQPTEHFRVTLFRDDKVRLSPALDKLDLSVKPNFVRSMNLDWPRLIRPRNATALTNYCKQYAFCKHDTHDDKCCNAFTGKCHHDC